MAVGRRLREQGIYCELETPRWLLALTGIGTTAEDLGQLIRAVAESNRRVGRPAEKNDAKPALPAGRIGKVFEQTGNPKEDLPNEINSRRSRSSCF